MRRVAAAQVVTMHARRQRMWIQIRIWRHSGCRDTCTREGAGGWF
jgi:hypothetical protein